MTTPTTDRRVIYSTRAVMRAALAEYGIDFIEFVNFHRTPRVSAMRSCIATALRELTYASYPEIAREMRVRSHASVHAQVKRGRANGGLEFADRVRARLEGKS